MQTIKKVNEMLFSYNPHLNFTTHALGKLNRDIVYAKCFERFFKSDMPLVQGDLFLHKCIGNHLCGDGPEKFIFFADFHFDSNRDLFELCSKFFSMFMFFIGAS